MTLSQQVTITNDSMSNKVIVCPVPLSMVAIRSNVSLRGVHCTCHGNYCEFLRAAAYCVQKMFPCSHSPPHSGSYAFLIPLWQLSLSLKWWSVIYIYICFPRGCTFCSLLYSASWPLWVSEINLQNRSSFLCEGWEMFFCMSLTVDCWEPM